MGVTCILMHEGKKYRFGTYNGAKAIHQSKGYVAIKKGKHLLEAWASDASAHSLAAPQSGAMKRVIHECPVTGIRYRLTRKGNALLDVTHPYGSYEYVFVD